MTRTLAAGAAALALALAAAACGGDDDGVEVPASASLAPADAPVFASATVRPEGDQAEAADSALSKLLNTDEPGGFLAEQLDTPLEDEDAPISYSEDIEPWLGENAGIFFTSFADEPDGAAVIEATDEAAAQATVDKIEQSEASRGTDESYGGVGYTRYEGDSAVGFVDSFLVAGTEGGLRAAVDASGGESLAEAEEFGDRLASAPDGTVATVYADIPAVLEGLFGGLEIDDPQDLNPLLGPLESDGPALVALAAESDQLTLQVDTAAEERPTQQSELLQTLPAESWLAFGLAEVGEYLNRGTDGQIPVYDFGLNKILPRELTEPELTDLEFRWIGDAGGFIAGTSIFGIGGALVLETTDETASANALGAIGRALGRDRSLGVGPPEGEGPGFTINPSGAPIQIVVTQRDGRVVVGLGERSVADALDPEEPLGDSEAFSPPADALGSDYSPALFLDFGPMLELLGNVGADDDPDLQSARPYLDHLEYLVAGSRNDDERALTRAALGLR